jgi:hypothetical protein
MPVSGDYCKLLERFTYETTRWTQENDAKNRFITPFLQRKKTTIMVVSEEG